MSKVKVRSPKGELNWVTINGRGKEDLNGNMIYTADVVTTLSAAQPLMDELDALWEEFKPKGSGEPKSMGYKVKEDETVVFTFKTKTLYPSGDTKEINVYNAKAELIDFPEDKKIGNGSIGRLSGMAAVYDAGKAARGVTLYLDAVQLTKFVEYSGGDAGFEEDDEGDFDTVGEAPFTAEDLV